VPSPSASSPSCRHNLRVGGGDVDAGLEEDLDDADAGVGVGLDVLDVVDRRRQDALERRRDAPGHLVRRQARVAPGHRDHRDADLGEDVGRRAQRGQRADDQQQQRHHDEGERAAQGDADGTDQYGRASGCVGRACGGMGATLGSAVASR